MNPAYRYLLGSLAAGLTTALPAQLVAQRQPLRPCAAESVLAAPQDTSVYRACEVDQPARLRRDARPSYRFTGQQTCATAVIAFVVDSTGVPDSATARVVETDTPDYAARLVGSLRDWRYVPAQHQGVRVRQVVQERRVLEDRERLPFRVAGSPPPPPRPPCR